MRCTPLANAINQITVAAQCDVHPEYGSAGQNALLRLDHRVFCNCRTSFRVWALIRSLPFLYHATIPFTPAAMP